MVFLQHPDCETFDVVQEESLPLKLAAITLELFLLLRREPCEDLVNVFVLVHEVTLEEELEQVERSIDFGLHHIQLLGCFLQFFSANHWESGDHIQDFGGQFLEQVLSYLVLDV